MEEKDLPQIVTPLLYWYQANARVLPWRSDPTPYHVWISEIMLQQTRVEAVISYYERFLSYLPDIASLAAVDDDLLMKLWEGLGYYSRARNLKKAAKVIMERYEGMLPSSVEALLTLPGIGPYTAGAIASIAYQQPEPAVDGNVIRVLTRLLADPTPTSDPALSRSLSARLRPIYPPEQSRAFTQALMELGAIVCIPNGAPHCEGCPLAFLCRARAENAVEDYPIRGEKKARKIIPRTILRVRCGERLAIRRREEGGLLHGLWELPAIEGHVDETTVREFLGSLGMNVLSIGPSLEAKHIFTHLEWHMHSFEVITDLPSACFVWASPNELHTRYALPSAFRAFLSETGQ